MEDSGRSCVSNLGQGNRALNSRSTLQESARNPSTPLTNGQSEQKFGSWKIQGLIRGLVNDLFWLE